MPFGDRLKIARQNRGLTQQQVGDAIGIAKSTVTGYEKGSSEPSIEKLQKLMDLLKVDANYLLQDDIELLSSGNQVLSPDEIQLLSSYRKLNDKGRESIQTLMEMHIGTYGIDKEGKKSYKIVARGGAKSMELSKEDKKLLEDYVLQQEQQESKGSNLI